MEKLAFSFHFQSLIQLADILECFYFWRLFFKGTHLIDLKRYLKKLKMALRDPSIVFMINTIKSLKG